MDSTPCRGQFKRWSTNNVEAKLLCRTKCSERVACLEIAVNLVDTQGHPVGIYGGVYLPDDNRVNDNPTKNHRGDVTKRRHSIELLREEFQKAKDYDSDQIAG